MPGSESSTGRTKQAASCCSGSPAFISVGELGRKRSSRISAKARSANAVASAPCAVSASDTASATRRNISDGVSIVPAASSRRR